MTLQIWPVIHVNNDDHEITFTNAQLADYYGCDGVLLISMEGFDDSLCQLAQKVKEQHPKLKVGVNHLTVSAVDSLLLNIDFELDATWTDRSGIHSSNDRPEPKEILNILLSNPQHTFFGSTAFKYQRAEPHPDKAAWLAQKHHMIPTTSGSGTGKAIKLDKLKLMWAALDLPKLQLAVASGVYPENLAMQAPYLSHVLVATGISEDHYNFSSAKLCKLMEVAAQFRPGIPDKVGVHATHCCALCGCKYGESQCPVVNKFVKSQYICEYCRH